MRRIAMLALTSKLRLGVAALAISLGFAATSMAESFQGRNYRLVDGRTSAAPGALVVAMHGFLGTERSMQRKTRFDALARQHGFIVLYPRGVRRAWNDGRSDRNRSDDVAYLAALVGQLVAAGRVDPERIYWAGHSNGGGMAMRMACDRPDLVAGISVVATKTSVNYQCAGGQGVPAIFFHGTDDPIAPHGGRSANSRLGATLSADQTLALWARRNGCGGPGRVQEIDRVDDGTRVEITQYSRCRKPLAHVVLHGAGHNWPGASGRGRQGPESREIDAAQLSWWFFEGRQN